MFQRTITPVILDASKTFYALCLMGPRQSGKTTLLKALFPEHTYLNLEDPDTLASMKSDPRGFFRDVHQKWIIDEAQEYPELFSYLLGFIDSRKVMGQFILSGSKNFILLEKISESLAGRIAILELLPLTYTELATADHFTKAHVWDLIYQGSYPGPYYHHANTDLWYKSYLTTYLQRDVRQLIHVRDLSKFHLFLKLCAGRHGQLINLSEIGAACGISHPTVAEWINLLELSYIVFRLPPYYKNFNKRLVKNHKLYFYDSGLVCHLLGIESGKHAQFHASRGALFEGYVISEVAKSYFSQGKTPPLYFWNSHKGFEIDLLIEKGSGLSLVEIKSSETFNPAFLQQLNQWNGLVGAEKPASSMVIYAGDKSFPIEDKAIVSYKNIDAFLPLNRG